MTGRVFLGFPKQTYRVPDNPNKRRRLDRAYIGMRCILGGHGHQWFCCSFRCSHSLSHDWTQRTSGHVHHNTCMAQTPFQAGGLLKFRLGFGAKRQLHLSTQCRGIGFDLGLIEPNRGEYLSPLYGEVLSKPQSHSGFHNDNTPLAHEHRC